MADYTHETVTVREHAAFILTTDGHVWLVNGRHGSYFAGREIVDNGKHWLRKPLASMMDKLTSGEIACVVVAEIEGKSAQIMISRDDFAKAAHAVAAYEAWSAEVAASYRARQAAEREHDLAHNEGGEGYNPHRVGDVPTYRRGRR